MCLNFKVIGLVLDFSIPVAVKSPQAFLFVVSHLQTADPKDGKERRLTKQ